MLTDNLDRIKKNLHYPFTKENVKTIDDVRIILRNQ